jgi:chromosome partitioning protein
VGANVGAKTVAVVNPKGGVGKTTTVLCLGELLVDRSPCVTLDLDPQAHATAVLSAVADPESRAADRAGPLEKSLDAALRGNCAIGDLLCNGGDRGWFVPAQLSLAATAVELARSPEGLQRLRQVLAIDWTTAHRALVDPILLLDCPPGLGFLTLSALVAADWVLVPVQCQPLALRSLLPLMEAIASIRRQLNPSLQVLGVLPTMVERRSPVAEAVLAGLADWAQASQGSIELLPNVPRSCWFPKLTLDGRLLRDHLPRSRRAAVFGGYLTAVDRLLSANES